MHPIGNRSCRVSLSAAIKAGQVERGDLLPADEAIEMIVHIIAAAKSQIRAT